MALRVIKNTLTENSPTLLYSGPHHQAHLEQCWASHLNNPLLNKLYKESISYTERWFLEVRRLINEEMWSHPLLNSVILDQSLKYNLIKSTIIDGAYMRHIINNESMPEYHMSASVNLKKLTKWTAFFISLPDSHETLVDLNAPTLD